MLRLTQLLAIVIAIGLFKLQGCSSESADSDDIRTSGMWAKMEVEGLADGRSRVTVELNVGGQLGTNVELSAGEYLEVAAGGQVKVMDEDTDFFDIDYQTYMDTNLEGTEFNVRFYRNNGENIVNSRGVIPVPFDFTAPVTPQTFTINDVVTLMWSPESLGNVVQLRATLSCPLTGGGTSTSSDLLNIADNGVYAWDISASSLFNMGTAGLDLSQLCSASFRLQRETFGQIDNAFEEGGVFVLRQIRNLEGVSVSLQ